ncbi:holin [Kitasatospora sp. NPDC005856]|uniref:holin n=1 Tax=Kitasatospora sp. NPDC005856 TaxID=3154566 RepID=UPI0033E24C87
MRKLILDLVERTVATYAVAFLGLLLADNFDLTSVGALRAAAVAALPAALTVVKGTVSTFVGDPNSAALLGRRARE